jgi:hypothetical protein
MFDNDVRVSIETFLSDPFYLGETCARLSPKITSDLEEVFGDLGEGEFGQGFSEVVYTGGRGSGNRLGPGIGLCRMLYELSKMDDPQAAFGLPPHAEIELAVFAPTEDLAKEFAIKGVYGNVRASTYFRKHFPCKSTQTRLRFPHNVFVTAYKLSPEMALGRNLFGAWFVDADDTTELWTEDPSSSRMLYDAIKRRIESRFRGHGKLFVSCAGREAHLVQSLIEASLTEGSLFVRNRPSWGLDQDALVDGYFEVLLGKGRIPSQILSKEAARRLQKSGLSDLTVLRVPDSYREVFEEDLAVALTAYAGVLP